MQMSFGIIVRSKTKTNLNLSNKKLQEYQQERQN